MLPQQRNIAYKLWISQLLNSNFIHEEDNNRSYIDVSGLKVSRVNLVGTIVIIRNNEGYSSAILDDGSAAIRIKAWQQDANMLADISQGDLVVTVGRVREYNDERYIQPDMLKKLDNPNWLIVRQLELFASHPKQINQQTKMYTEERVAEPVKLTLAARNKVLNAIESLEMQEGATIDMIISSSLISKNEVLQAVSELVKEGQIYEHKPGRYKLLQ